MLSSAALLGGGVTISAILVIVFSVLFIRYYIEATASIIVIFIASLAISVSLFSLVLIPIDIYSVSGFLKSDGTQLDPHLVHISSHGIQYIYYVFYFLLSSFIAFFLPFTYFYIEEDSSERTFKTRILSALKNTCGFVIVFIVLLILGLLLKKNKGGESQDWIGDISSTYNNTDVIVSFLIGSFSCLGMFGWITYTAYGMATFPVQMCKRKIDVNAYTRLAQGRRDLATQLAINQEKEQYLVSSLNSDNNIQNIQRLKNERHDLSKRMTKKVGDDQYAAPSTRCWNYLRPFWILMGIFFFLVGNLVIISLALTTIDKLLYSKCGYSCGFAIARRTIINPTDIILIFTSSVFPVDFILFALIILYVFVCSVYGIMSLGIRICCFQLYKLTRRSTLANAMIMGSWLLIFIVIILNMELSIIAPHYVHYGGDQYFYPLNSTNSSILNGSQIPHNSVAIPKLCSLTNSIKTTGPDQCIMSQVGIFVTKLFIRLPFFGAIIFFSNILFLVIYLVSFSIAVLRFNKQPSINEENDDDIWSDDL